MKQALRILTTAACSLILLLQKHVVKAQSNNNNTGCDCQTVDSFDDLKSILSSSLATTTTTTIRLCPFEIEKSNSEIGIELADISNVHIMCAKDSRSDACLIYGVGNTGSSNGSLYEAFHLQGTDSITMQGLTFRNMHKGAIRVQSSMNIQVIDTKFEYCQSPPMKTGAIVEIMDSSSSVYLVDCEFRDNSGGAVQNKGFLTVSHCVFEGNAATPEWISNDETETQGGGAGAGILNSKDAHLMLYDSVFIDNIAEKSGPAVFSYDIGGIDLGSNCGSGNRIVDNIQAEEEVVLGVCDGIYYLNAGNGSERQCATFGGACSS